MTGLAPAQVWYQHGFGTCTLQVWHLNSSGTNTGLHSTYDRSGTCTGAYDRSGTRTALHMTGLAPTQVCHQHRSTHRSGTCTGLHDRSGSYTGLHMTGLAPIRLTPAQFWHLHYATHLYSPGLLLALSMTPVFVQQRQSLSSPQLSMLGHLTPSFHPVQFRCHTSHCWVSTTTVLLVTVRVHGPCKNRLCK